MQNTARKIGSIVALSAILSLGACQPRHELYRASLDVQLAETRVAQTEELPATTELAGVETIAFIPPEACVDESSRLPSSGILCAALMGSLEAEAIDAGFTVISWREFLDGVSVVQPAHDSAADAVMHVSEWPVTIDLAQSIDEDAIRWERQPLIVGAPRPWRDLEVDDEVAMRSSCSEVFFERLAEPLHGTELHFELSATTAATPLLFSHKRFVSATGSDELTLEYLRRVQTNQIGYAIEYVGMYLMISGVALIATNLILSAASDDFSPGGLLVYLGLATAAAGAVAFWGPWPETIDTDASEALCTQGYAGFTYEHPRYVVPPKAHLETANRIAIGAMSALARNRWSARAATEAR